MHRGSLYHDPGRRALANTAALVLSTCCALACESGRSIPGGDPRPNEPRDGSVAQDAPLELEGGAAGDAPGPIDGAPGPDASGIDSAPFGPDAEALLDGAAPPDAGSADAGPTTGDAGVVPICLPGCTTPADCAQPSSLYDASHYRCTAAGACEWTGCRGPSDCSSALGANWTCAPTPGFNLMTCVLACSTPSDCALATALNDADNYRCNGGACEWLGCNTDDECRSTFQDQRYRCVRRAEWPYPNCERTCTAPSDCASTQPAYDADNYRCNAGRCEYTGCRSDVECQQTAMNPEYVCR